MSCPPLYQTPLPSTDPKSRHHVPGVWFDQAAVDRVVAALGELRHYKGRWAGRPLVLEPWQLDHIVAPIFGWKHPDGERVIRSAYIEVPRKNGKSSLAAGLAIVLLLGDGEPGSEVYAAAGSKGQAKIVHNDAKKMVMSSPSLSKAVAAGKIKPLADAITVPGNTGVFRVVSKAAELAHGLNVHGAIIDELHVHKTRDLVDALETGTGARAQPLIITITTADEGDETTIYAEKRGDIVGLADGTLPWDPSTYGAIWAAPDDADPFDESTWEKANPNLDVSVSREHLRKEAARAQRTPSYLPTFCRLYLNRRMRQKVRWLDIESWRASAGLVDEETLRDRECYGGLDLASSDDFAAWALVFPNDELRVRTHEGDTVTAPGYEVLLRTWCTEASVGRRPKLERALRTWQAEGWLTVVDGDVIDYDAIEAQVFGDAERFRIAEFAFDPWQAEQLRQHLMDGGLEGFKHPQQMAHMAGPSLELERLVVPRRIHHGANPVLDWMVGNAIAKRDAEGRVKPDRQNSSEKIDGVVALVMALGAAIRPREASVAAAWSAPADAEDRTAYASGDRLDL